jgi:hypothetical protein
LLNVDIGVIQDLDDELGESTLLIGAIDGLVTDLIVHDLVEVTDQSIDLAIALDVES